MDGYTKQRCSDWSSPMELDMSVCPGTVIRPDMPLGSGPAKSSKNPSAPIPMRQQDLSRCPSYFGSMNCPGMPPKPMNCPSQGVSPAMMKCPEMPPCPMPVKCPSQGVSPAVMKCPEMPPCPMPMKCPSQGVSPAVMKCPEMPPCPMPVKCPPQGVSPAVTKCPEMPPCRMRCPEMPPKPAKCPSQGVSPAVTKCPEMPPCPVMYPDMPPCRMRPNMPPMGVAPGMCTGAKPAECSGAECIDRYPVGMAYVPWQRWQELYSVDTAIEMGTIFPDLFKPFLMGGCK